MKYATYSIVVIGSGIAGLYATLKLEQQKKFRDGILLVTKSVLDESNSNYAQGGIVGVLKENKKDSTSSHISDTLKAGAGLSDFNTVKYISENSDKVIKDLLNFGINFDKNENGEFNFTLEAAHSVNRILHCGGDATGRMIEQALVKNIIKSHTIDIKENTLAIEIITDDECKGVIVYDNESKEYITVYSPIVILATGGIGQLYEYTTNPKGATGDGIALAYNAGAVLQDMEFVQFHPTALALNNSKRRFLISEAVRGEGAKLITSDGHEFMAKYHDKKELAPRDIVTRAIYNEMLEKNIDNVYLNATIIDNKKLQKRFPTISQFCLNKGIDISKDYIPVAPAAHYFMGGIKTDIYGRTSIKGLFAIGEVASTGLHGANRLASNSLLECVVCAYSVCKYLKTQNITSVSFNKKISSYCYSPDMQNKNYDINNLKSELQNTMWTNVGILRSENSLKTALTHIIALSEKFSQNKISTKEEYEFKNMLLVSQLIINSALNRKESRGAHYRLDYPNINKENIHSIITNKTGELNFAK